MLQETKSKMTGKHRDSTELRYLILKHLMENGSSRWRELSYGVEMLCGVHFKHHIIQLSIQGFIFILNADGTKYYSITDKGREYYQLIKQEMEMLSVV